MRGAIYPRARMVPHIAALMQATRKSQRSAAPWLGFFLRAPGRPFPFFRPPPKRGDGAPGGARGLRGTPWRAFRYRLAGRARFARPCPGREPNNVGPCASRRSTGRCRVVPDIGPERLNATSPAPISRPAPLSGRLMSCVPEPKQGCLDNIPSIRYLVKRGNN